MDEQEKVMNEQEKVIELLKTSTLSAYKIAKETGISEAAIGKYLANKSKPNKIYTKCLTFFFDTQMKNQTTNSQNHSIIENNNTVAGKNISNMNMDSLIKQLESKDNVIQSLLKTQEILLSQIDKLISQ